MKLLACGVIRKRSDDVTQIRAPTDGVWSARRHRRSFFGNPKKLVSFRRIPCRVPPGADYGERTRHTQCFRREVVTPHDPPALDEQGISLLIRLVTSWIPARRCGRGRRRGRSTSGEVERHGAIIHILWAFGPEFTLSRWDIAGAEGPGGDGAVTRAEPVLYSPPIDTLLSPLYTLNSPPIDPLLSPLYTLNSPLWTPC
eukprot:1187776-Prorocentrum_minimum.AAC.3